MTNCSFNVKQQSLTHSINVKTYCRYFKGQLFIKHPLIDHLAEKLLHVFVSIEVTGQSVQFEQKFNYRRPMYQVLEHIWEIESHRKAIKVGDLNSYEIQSTVKPAVMVTFV